MAHLRPSLDTLFPELVYGIFDHLGPEEDLPISERDIRTVSLATGRLRSLAFPCLCDSVEVTWWDMIQLVRRKCSSNMDGKIATQIR